MRNALLLPCLFMLALVGCNSDQPAPQATQQAVKTDPQPVTRTADDDQPTPGKDYHSYANPEAIRVTHLDLEMDVDFEQKVIHGKASLDLVREQPNAQKVTLDTRDLEIIQVVAEPSGKALKYHLGQADENLGAWLSVKLEPGIDRICIEYKTVPGASGLQWLTPEQTAGKQHPFLFTQSQAIHARSWIPLQDTPQVRLTYNATVRTPKNLRAVMSANNDPNATRTGEYHFEMPQAIPSYLIALGVGDLDFKAMSDRTGVYAEPVLLDASAAEFGDTEAMMVVSEELFGPYRWGRYDLLILPPSFPFGGMENPRLSFITPTVIAGDKSLVALIAHELAHSWSGNLVTNATWNDLWLNEGFTVYLEARIMEAVFGHRREAMEAVLGHQGLVAEFEELNPADQRLATDLRDRDPDDAFTGAPYEKGRLMLVYLESAVGREKFDEFLQTYFDRYAFQSLSTAAFMDYLNSTLLADNPTVRERIQEWVYQPGIPEDAVLPSSPAFDDVDAARGQWLSGAAKAADLNTANWSVHEWLYFLNNMPSDLSGAQLNDLDQAFDLTNTRNNEIAHSWLLIAIRHHYQPALPRLQEYLIGIGRRKLIVPLYRALAETDWGLPFASEVYQKARPGYHPLAQSTLDPLFNDS